MRLLAVLLLASLIALPAACDRTKPGAPSSAARPGAPGRVSRQVPDTRVPAHPLRDRFLGEWQSKDKDGAKVTAFVIAAQAAGEGGDGTVTIEQPPSPKSEGYWESVINNVRFEDRPGAPGGAVLRFDLYLYYTGDKSFKTVTNPLGDHPFSGVRNDTTLTLTDDPDRLRESGQTKATPTPIEADLTRAKPAR